jgi:hypothetical protein
MKKTCRELLKMISMMGVAFSLSAAAGAGFYAGIVLIYNLTH